MGLAFSRRDGRLGNLPGESNLVDTSKAVGLPSSNGVYFWRVSSASVSGWGPYGQVGWLVAYLPSTRLLEKGLILERQTNGSFFVLRIFLRQPTGSRSESMISGGGKSMPNQSVEWSRGRMPRPCPRLGATFRPESANLVWERYASGS